MSKDDELKFLRAWKDDIVTSLGKFDANSIEEVYEYGIKRGYKEAYNSNMIDNFVDDILNIIGKKTWETCSIKFEETLREIAEKYKHN